MNTAIRCDPSLEIVRHIGHAFHSSSYHHVLKFKVWPPAWESTVHWTWFPFIQLPSCLDPWPLLWESTVQWTFHSSFYRHILKSSTWPLTRDSMVMWTFHSTCYHHDLKSKACSLTWDNTVQWTLSIPTDTITSWKTKACSLTWDSMAHWTDFPIPLLPPHPKMQSATCAQYTQLSFTHTEQ